MSAAFAAFADACGNRIEVDVPRRPANALNVEVGTPFPRCTLRLPSNWGERAPSAARWLLSGGDALVFGYCALYACPLRIADGEAHA